MYCDMYLTSLLLMDIVVNVSLSQTALQSKHFYICTLVRIISWGQILRRESLGLKLGTSDLLVRTVRQPSSEAAPLHAGPTVPHTFAIFFANLVIKQFLVLICIALIFSEYKPFLRISYLYFLHCKLQVYF